MNKDKGNKNVKKLPAGKSSGKVKIVSDYKLESKGGISKSPVIEAFLPKNEAKSSGKKS